MKLKDLMEQKLSEQGSKKHINDLSNDDLIDLIDDCSSDWMKRNRQFSDDLSMVAEGFDD